jgi:hypothetical protein
MNHPGAPNGGRVADRIPGYVVGMSTVPSASSDSPPEATLTDVSRQLDADGFDGQFRAEPGALIQCLTCRETTPATSLDANDMTRLEGESDPADMAMVVALRCPACGTGGTLILNYGPDASAEEADVLAALDRTAT